MNKVALILYEYPLGVSSMLINSAILFARNGHDVTVFIDEGAYRASPMDFEEQNIKIHQIEISQRPVTQSQSGSKGQSSSKLNVASSLRPLINRLIKWKISWNMRNVGSANKLLQLKVPEYYSFCQQLKELLDKDYGYILGVEPAGLYAGMNARNFEAQVVVYYNMELIQDISVQNLKQYLQKKLEELSLPNTNYTVIQNENRKSVFLRENNNVSESSVIQLPVAALGDPYTASSNYFRTMFDIPEDKKIVLYAGNIKEWAMCLEIVESVSRWNDEYCLVMHSWGKGIEESAYFKKIKNLAEGKPVYFSLKPVDYQQLDEVLASADIGLMFYQAIDENFIDIDFSSNKLAQYMKVGLPVIANDYPGLVKLLEGNQCGTTLSEPARIAEGLNRIFKDYEKYRENVIAFYKENLEFSKYFDHFYKTILST